MAEHFRNSTVNQQILFRKEKSFEARYDRKFKSLR